MPDITDATLYLYIAVELNNSVFIHVPKTGGRNKQMLFSYVKGLKYTMQYMIHIIHHLHINNLLPFLDTL